MALNEQGLRQVGAESIPIEGMVIPADEEIFAARKREDILDLDLEERSYEVQTRSSESEEREETVSVPGNQKSNAVHSSNTEESSSSLPSHPRYPKRTDGGIQTFGELTSRSSRLFKGLNIIVLTMLIVGTGLLLAIGDWGGALGYFAILLATVLILFAWRREKTKGLPMLPVFVLQQAVIYSIPFLARDEGFLITQQATLAMASYSTVVFLGATFAGWRISSGIVRRFPRSRFPLILLDQSNRRHRSLALGLGFLLFALLFQLSVRTGVIFELLSGEASRVFPIVRTLAGAATVLGAVVGGMVVGNRKRGVAKWSFFSLVIVNLLLSVIDFRLMEGATILVACATGLAMARRRIPWSFLIVSLLFLGFLNQSKFTLRQKYWEDDKTWVVLSVKEYPRLYREWFLESWRIITTADGGVREALLAQQSDDELGQSILDRIDNLGNLTYVIDAIKEKNIPVLYGETYLMTPQLLIPRVFWPDKPRTHEGQVLLNLHFQRQLSREHTEKTYVAWGALPEAVGNFGPFFGPVWVGLFIGLVLGVLERLSVRQHLFSIEGLLLIGTLVKIGTAHEMVASVFITSLFQYVVIICFAGAVIRTFFATVDPNLSKYPPASRF